ncbi:MAG: hypothetical protein H3C30_04525 [Candidatus Hydrogenedentes bacterium]|nr:hypothetical protein [Candidatus Hydrogenedentota bacterium]
MMYEYAVDPVLFSSVERARYLRQLFGRDKGRIIAYFPEQWKDIVEQTDSPLERVRLRNLVIGMLKDRTLFRCRRCDYNKKLYWWENALNHHVQLREFRAIISKQATRDCFVHIDELEENPKMSIKLEAVIPRIASEMAKVAAPLLQLSSEIRFVDPYFDPTEKSNYHATFKAFMDAAHSESSIPVTEIQFHLKYNNRKNKDPNDYNLNDSGNFEDACIKNISPLIPNGKKVTFFRWKNMRNGDGLHPRYILTNIAGISYDYGLDQGFLGQTTDVKLITGEIFNTRWNQFKRDGAGFRPMDQFVINGK